MRNLFAINPIDKTIIASKTTLKKASIPNSPEYKALMKLMKANPAFTVEAKVIKEAIGKNTYKGLTDAFIKEYISIKENAAKLTKEYEEAYKRGKFIQVRKWFLDVFKNFNMADAKKEIEKARLAQIKAASAPENNVVDMPVAVNQ